MTQPLMYSVLSNNVELKVWATTATTSATGALTVTLPDSIFSNIVNIQATCIRNTVTPSQASFAMVRSFTTSQVVIQVFESKSSTIGIGGTAEGLELATTATTVLVTVFGN